MDILFLLIPLSVSAALAIVAVLWWAADNGQFDNLEHEANRILDDDMGPGKR